MPSGGEVSRVGLLQLVLSESAARRVRANKTSFSAQSPITRPFAIRVTAEPPNNSETGQDGEKTRGEVKKLQLFFFAKSDFGSLLSLFEEEKMGNKREGGKGER